MKYELLTNTIIMSKKMLIGFILLSVIIGCKETKDKNEKEVAVISGEIINQRDNNILFYYNHSLDTVLAQDGRFSAEINISEPSYIYFVNNFNNAVFFIGSNESLSIEANYQDFIESLKIEGSNKNINEYLIEQNKLIANTAFNSAEFMYASNPDVFMASYNTFKRELNEHFEDFKKEVEFENEQFESLEAQRIKYLHLPLVLQYYSRVSGQGTNADIELQKHVDNNLADVDINNSELLKIREYKDFLYEYSHFKFVEKVLKESLEINTIEEYAEVLFGIIDSEFTNDHVLEEIYIRMVDEIVNNYGVDGMKPYYEKLKEMTEDTERLASIEQAFEVWNKIAPGEPSADFSFPDIDDNMYSLDDFKGQYLYIDVWATWCGPCIREIPHLKQLKKQFEGKNIEIIAISVDENKTDWVNFVNNENLQGVQLFAGGWNNEFIQHFMITGIPRFILLDREGNIINANAPRPSAGVETTLNNLEGI